ncbi:hypothetical protein FQN55_003091 [Onygenales sp. PD_40]|nr:hypothetical protein FQN55_003091 [Onygenales sp. PD_40]KAK2799559.1 hypothetical protein FQN51_006873 [Onygenales sp. PD_10]
MSGLLQNLLKGDSNSPSPAPSADDADFADFPGAPEAPPAALPISAASSAPSAATTPLTPLAAGAGAGAGTVPYTKWYRVWERTTPADFIQEAFIIPFILVIVAFHVWGTRKNRRRAARWAAAHVPVLQSEFAVVGYSGVARPAAAAVEAEGLARASEDAAAAPESVLKEKSGQEFATYATGRANVAFVDVSIQLLKRFNPLYLIGDHVVSLFFDSWPSPVERVECVAYSFDGKERELVPAPKPEREAIGKGSASGYDGFVFAVVHKNSMRRLREDRYDVTLTFTKDNAKLPEWVTVMSESAEITDMMLTADLVKAVEEAGQDFEYLIVTDQPLDKPTKIDETTPRKRIYLSLRLPTSNTSTLPIFTHFLRLTDRLVSAAHFRAEVSRKLRNTREDEIRKLKRADEEEKAEERKVAAEKLKKEERERLLRGMSAEEQRKYLEKEREREQKRGMKRATRRG